MPQMIEDLMLSDSLSDDLVLCHRVRSQQGDEYDILDASDEDDDDAPPGIATMDPHFMPSAGLRQGPGHAERPTPAHDPMDVDDVEDEADDESEDLEDAELEDYS